LIDLNKIVGGIDQRTTIMMKNVPKQWHRRDIRGMLDSVAAGSYDLILTPEMPFRRGVGGTVFVNFTDVQAIRGVCEAFTAWGVSVPGQSKPLQIRYSKIQGYKKLVKAWGRLDEEFRKAEMGSPCPTNA